MVAGSTPCTMTPARFEALDAMTSPWTTGVAASTPLIARTRASVGSASPQEVWAVVSTTMCALTPPNPIDETPARTDALRHGR